jgi:hypothetical protein
MAGCKAEDEVNDADRLARELAEARDGVEQALVALDSNDRVSAWNILLGIARKRRSFKVQKFLQYARSRRP